MRRDEIRNALDEVAGRELGPPRDLWPEVRRGVLARRPGAGHIVIEAAGHGAGRLWPAAALLVLLLIASVTLGPALLPNGHPGTVSTPAPLAGPSPRVAPSPPPQASPPPAQATPAGAAPAYGKQLTMDLAKRLGVDPVALDAAFQAAANDTIDQAVRDGAMTPDAAAQARSQAGQGLAALFTQGFAGQGTGSAPPDMNALLDQWLATITSK